MSRTDNPWWDNSWGKPDAHGTVSDADVLCTHCLGNDWEAIGEVDDDIIVVCAKCGARHPQSESSARQPFGYGRVSWAASGFISSPASYVPPPSHTVQVHYPPYHAVVSSQVPILRCMQCRNQLKRMDFNISVPYGGGHATGHLIEYACTCGRRISEDIVDLAITQHEMAVQVGGKRVDEPIFL